MRIASRWLRRLTSASRRPNRNLGLRSPRMNMMCLEERAVPATFTVSLLGDAGMADGSDTTGLSGDIRYCVDQANLTAGTPDTIVFSNAPGSPFLSATTITLGSTLALTDTVDFDGTSVGGKNKIAVSGGGSVRVFSVAGTQTATFNNISIINGKSTTGGFGGGGGAVFLSTTTDSVTFNNCIVANHVNTGTGGAISVLGGHTGLITINNSTFSGNQGSSGGALYFYTTGNLTISGSTFTGNKSTSGTGGAFYIYSGSATITTSTFSNNQGAGNGGAITINSSAPVTIADCVFSGNTAPNGAAISRSGGTGATNISNSSFTNNTATTNGGAFNLTGASNTTISGSSFSGNIAALGGAINQSTGTITFDNNTVSGNTATGTSGGGGLNFSGGIQNLRNSTVAFNNATGTGSTGGGLRRSAGTLTLSSTIVGKNTSKAGGVDAHSTAAVSVAGDNNLIGNPTGGNITYTGVTTNGDPLLASLTAALGGTTAYHPLLAGSPAINAGNDIYGLGTDQRGAGYPRVVGPSADIGAFEGFVTIPSATASLPNVPPVNPGYVATVTYTDETGINTGTIGTGDVRLTGPAYGSPEMPASFKITAGMMGDKSVTVEYTFTPPGGSWDYPDNGTYTLVMQPNEVYDTEGSPNAVPGGSLGTFSVTIPLPVLVVDNDGDIDDGIITAGQFTLREALKLTNGAPGTTDTITFSPSLNGKTITVGTPLSITDGVIIDGPGPANLAVSGGSLVRVFEVSGNVLVTYQDISIINGASTVGGSGGGGGATWVKSTGTSITFDNCVVSGHTNTSTGGALSIPTGFTGTITVNNSTFSGNSSTRGGAIYFWTTGTLNITNSKFNNNTSTGGGGAINPWSVLTNIVDSVFADNTAAGNGGALEMSGAATMTISGSTFSGNTAALGGAIYQPSTAITITNSTISGNKATGAGGGGGIALGTPTANIRNTTITKNEAIGGTGGGIRKTSATGVLTLSSTIVADNLSASGGADITGTVAIAIAGNNNLVGIADVGGFTLAGTNQTGTAASPLNPNLGPLQNNGGTTDTHAVLPGSPASFNGNNDFSLTYDQRGLGYPRSVGGTTDIGAVQGDPTIPGGKATGPTIAAVTMSDQTITVTYTVGVGSIDAATLDNNDVLVTGPGGYSKNGTLIGGPYTSASTIVAQYKLPPNDNGIVGSWDGKDAGLYTVNLQANQVKTLTAVSAPAGPIGTFRVAIGQVLLVDNATNDIDDGLYGTNELNFREAIKLANDNAFATDTITFKGTVFTAGTTILMSAGYDITDSVVITGPGVGNLTLDGQGSYRGLNITDGSATAISVTMSGLKVQGGAATSANGAGFLVTGEKLSLTDVEISGNNVNTGGNGGGISLVGTATLNLDNVRILNNTSPGHGGGIDGGPGGATITINNSTIANNTAVNTGGGISNGDVVMTITNSTVSGNSLSGGTSKGGGISTYAGQVTIENSTISNNQGNEGGGIALLSFGKTLTLRHSTVFGNNAFGGNGGGIRRVSGGGTIDVFSSVVSGNIGATSADISSTGTVNVNYSAVGSNAGFTLTGSKNLGFGVDVKLGPLQKNPGTANTETHLPAQGSPLFNAGPSSTTIAFDQRGAGFPRLLQGRVDIGAVEDINNLPTAAMNALGPITVAAATPDVVTIVYTDNGTITASSIKTGNIQIMDSLTMTPLTIISATATPNTNAPSISVDYKFAVPGGAWSKAANDTYIVRLLAANSVVDNDTNPVVTSDTDIGNFVVAIPITYLVDLASDIDDGNYTSGNLTLREAISLANGDGTSSIINFLGSAFPASTKIDVATEMSITQPVTINGPGMGNLILDGELADLALTPTRIFNINGAKYDVVSISDMTIQKGKVTGNGGGILMDDEDVTLTRVKLSNNVASTSGGAISVGNSAASKLTVDRSIISNNVATGSHGAGIFVNGASGSNDADILLNILDSTISGNTAGTDGAAVYMFWQGTATIRNSTINNNVSTTLGGAFYFYAVETAIISSTIYQNQGGTGGGIYLTSLGNTVIRNSTIDSNSGSTAGGNISITGGTLTMSSTIVSNGVSPAGPDINGAVTAATFSLIEDTTAATIPPDATNKTGVDPNLDTKLAANGAAADRPLTLALLAPSPAINAGTDVNVPPLAYDQRGVGFARKVGSAVDIGAYEVQTAVAPPTVSAVLTNGAASGQHSRVMSIVINFSEVVTIANPANAFQVNRYYNITGGDTANGSVGYNVAGLDAMNKGSSVTLTFNNSGTLGALDPGGSLRDGKYEVVVVANQVAGAGGFLDGNANGKYDPSDPLGDNNRTTTWRLFGDGDGNGAVNSLDFAGFRGVFGLVAPNSPYDFDGIGTVNNLDFAQFRGRFGLSGYQIP